MEKILDGNDYAKAQGFENMREMLKSKQYNGFDTPYVDVTPEGTAVSAYISFGFWIATCECNGAEYVAPEQPFYCHSCGNFENNGKPRPVIFPEEKAKIESELLKRPVSNGPGRNSFERTQRQRAVINVNSAWLSRTWYPNETVADLKEQNKNIPRRKGKS